MKTLIVPVDETAASERAVPIAGAMAAALGADVVLTTVDSAHVEPGPSEAYLRSLHAQIPPGVHVGDLVVRTDEAFEDVLARELIERGGTLVMGTHARTGVAELVLGNTADVFVGASAGPVVLVGSHVSTAWSPGLVVVASDGSPRDAHVIDVAAAWARITRSPLAILHVATSPRSEAARGLDEATARLREAGLTATSHLLDAAKPAEAVLRWTGERETSLLVVGSQPKSRLRRAVLGSVSTAIVAGASSPVLVAGTGAR